jgi:lipoprotein-releasing system permease protein
MYKLLLCWRYLLTRYLAVLCVVSVMLGVATLIVVNSVMSGFSTKLKDRLHGLLSDVLIESGGMEGFPDPTEKMERIKNSPVGKYVAAMTPTIETMAIMQFYPRDQHGILHPELFTRPVRLIGVDPAGRSAIGGYAEYLVDERDRAHPSFELNPDAKKRNDELNPPLADAGQQWPPPEPLIPGEPPPPDPPEPTPRVTRGIVIGDALAHIRAENGDLTLLKPGDDIWVTTVNGQKLQPVRDRYAVCDYFKSEMAEYDSNYVFVPLDYLQNTLTMQNRATTIQVRLTDFSHAKEVTDTLKTLFPASHYTVQTWEDKQGALLAAIAVERGILNVLLFMIVGVAGFGILAIFSMIVVEKTRDIGILKSLGASNRGVMSIFLSYGLLLGSLGAGLGTVLGLGVTNYINPIEKFISRVTGQEVFPRKIYYFDEIPTHVQPLSVILVVLGAVAIAVFFSILPALRAAVLHPVRALRYE